MCTKSRFSHTTLSWILSNEEIKHFLSSILTPDLSFILMSAPFSTRNVTNCTYPSLAAIGREFWWRESDQLFITKHLVQCDSRIDSKTVQCALLFMSDCDMHTAPGGHGYSKDLVGTRWANCHFGCVSLRKCYFYLVEHYFWQGSSVYWSRLLTIATLCVNSEHS